MNKKELIKRNSSKWGAIIEVRCPICGGKAMVTVIPYIIEYGPPLLKVRFECNNCGYEEEKKDVV